MLMLLLGDSRFPAGGHAHSGGMEQAVEEGAVHDVASLQSFLEGRLRTVVTVEAHAAARACLLAASADPDEMTERALNQLDEEIDARMPSPAARATSRAQGSALAAACRAVLGVNSTRNTHLATAWGVVAAAARLDAGQAATLAIYQSTAGPASAALRLLGLDPLAVCSCLARLAETCDVLASGAAEAALSSAPLPAGSALLLDVLAEEHFTRLDRLFAS
jgi:urease accessory protein